MNETDIEQCKQKLLVLRSELLTKLEESSRVVTKPVDFDHASMSRIARMDAIQSQKTAEEGARQRKRQIQKIDGALRRIELGEFGRCFICEEELEEHRLSEDPTITRCVNCVEP